MDVQEPAAGKPIGGIDQPDVKEASSNVAKCKQSPLAQPSTLRALEDAMEAAAETNDPTWLAPLASWLQAMANLRLIHLLRRSAPVKLYDRWMLFFCKQGKQGHDECCPAHAVQPSKVGQAATLWNPYAYFCPNTHAGLISLLQWNNTQHRGTGSISQCTGNVRWPTTGPPLLTVIQKLAQSLGVFGASSQKCLRCHLLCPPPGT
jgi:hypothetical protein